MKKLKKILSYLFAFLLLSVPLIAQDSTAVGDGPVDDTNWVVVVIGALVAVIEIVMRAIPKESLKGILGLVIDILKNISDYMNRKESK